MASWSKDNLLSFIEIYRSLDCLWKVKSKDYSNKLIKEEAYQQLVSFTKTFEPRADRELVTKKINILRTNFRKELKKVEYSKLSGPGEEDLYVPKLFYFQNMMFLRGQEMPGPSVASIQHSKTPTNFTPVDSDVLDTLENGLSCEAGGSIKEELLSDGEATQSPEFNEVTPIPTPTTASLISSIPGASIGKGKSRPNKRKTEDETLSLTCNCLSMPPEDEHDALAKAIAYKMRKLMPQQCFYAEKLITDVLYEARICNLSRESHVVASNASTCICTCTTVENG